MVALSENKSSKFVKLMYIGDSGTGKTGSLVSLVAAGYKLRILDMDNGVPVLRNYIQEQCPDNMHLVDYETCRNKYKMTDGGPIVSGAANAYIKATKLMTKWSDDTVPSEWGPDTVFVLDSLTGLGRSALEWARSMNMNARDGRQWYNTAQRSIETILALLTSDSFECNVIVISHIQYIENEDEPRRGFANSVGKALGPIIPSYFNTMICAEMTGIGKNATRSIRTVPNHLIALKNPAPFKLDEKLPLGTGLATLFENLKEI